jgi:hypothetical protein
MFHAPDLHTALKAETIRGLVQGDEVLLSFLVGKTEVQEVAVVWFVKDTTLITNNGKLIRLDDGVDVQSTGNHFERFSYTPKAEEKFQLYKKGYYVVRVVETEPEPE